MLVLVTDFVYVKIDDSLTYADDAMTILGCNYNLCMKCDLLSNSGREMLLVYFPLTAKESLSNYK